ncbi:hypothetical protein DSC_11895 [Pseudoxanthomonas spadix BD-a59]|uniref:Lipoprotein n=1 Tax=Pseudoxanthomonas spadix (strain BD-a59) TaxID=1045855 RepID=G7UQV1_PSEUP|nr:hypothetical protein [Pseudoxanthomonas spadix]AER57023.1 hypothetical protein DSC_11895 [Pseudoxanthomonas spadix BD-a59]
MKAARTWVCAVGTASVLLVSGCGSSPEDRVYLAFKCSKVATLLERDTQGDIALSNVMPELKELEGRGGSFAQFAMEMGERFQDDVPLYRMTVSGQMAALTNVYESDECEALYQPNNRADQ